MTESTAPLSGKLLWTPSEDALVSSQVAAFAAFVKERTGMDWQEDFQTLWRWSADENVRFWDAGRPILSGCRTELRGEHACTG